MPINTEAKYKSEQATEEQQKLAIAIERAIERAWLQNRTNPYVLCAVLASVLAKFTATCELYFDLKGMDADKRGQIEEAILLTYSTNLDRERGSINDPQAKAFLKMVADMLNIKREE